jgi:hypothetical protein
MTRRSHHSYLSGSEYETIDIDAGLSDADSSTAETLPPQQNKKHIKSRTHGQSVNRSKASKGKQRKVTICYT